MNTADLMVKNAEHFYNQLKDDKNSRYRSWEHCYSKFYNARKNIPDDSYIDYLSLHLAFYLASWGMYRGSSFLLQQDYKIHIPIVKEILNPKYDKLQGITCCNLKRSENLDLLEELTDYISSYYDNIRKKLSKKTLKNDLSDTLITKILMGTLGCVPAYDRYFIDGIKKQHISTGIYNKNSLLKLISFYEANKKVFEPIINKMKIGTIPYPEMKLLDMGLWQIGLDFDTKKEKNND